MENIEEDAIASLKETITNIEKKQKDVQAEIRKAKKIVRDLEKPGPSNRTAYNDFVNAKFSHAAKYAVELSEGPLEGDILIEFLMKAFRKPKPGVLDISRQYTWEVDKLIEQLQEVKDGNNDLHKVYKEEQRRLDENLNRRIDLLIKNLKKELNAETKSGMKQSSLNTYVTRSQGKRGPETTEEGASGSSSKIPNTPDESQ